MNKFNKLNNPIVILILIILTLCNTVLSIVILTRINENKKSTKTRNKISIEEETDEVNMEDNNTMEIGEEPLYVYIRNTEEAKMDGYTRTPSTSSEDYYNFGNTFSYDYSYSEWDNIHNFLEGYLFGNNNSTYTVTLREIDNNLVISSDTKKDVYYNEDVLQNVRTMVENSEKLTSDIFVENNESGDGHVDKEFPILPSYIGRIYRINNYWENEKDCPYFLPNKELINYIETLI